MNGKFEEQLARLAFGDVSPEEAARIERQAQNDPKAALALAEFRRMREGLRDLAAVPEHQLSNERLRDALLARGLNGKPADTQDSSRGAGWLWMPVAAAALGFGLFMLRTHRTAEPEVVLNSTSVVNHGYAVKFPDPSSAPGAPGLKTMVAENREPKPNPVTAPSRSGGGEFPASRHGSGRHSRRFTRDATDVAVHWPSATIVVGPPLGEATDATSTPIAENTNPPIVLIDGNTDETTGAPTATEVGTASNVVIGG